MKYFIKPFYKSNNKLHKYFVTFILFIRNILSHLFFILSHFNKSTISYFLILQKRKYERNSTINREAFESITNDPTTIHHTLNPYFATHWSQFRKPAFLSRRGDRDSRPDQTGWILFETRLNAGHRCKKRGGLFVTRKKQWLHSN